MRSVLYILIFAILVVSCEQPTEFERENKNDPISKDFIPKAIENFELEVNENHIRLEWKPGSEFINGFLLEKTNAAGEFEELQTFDKRVTNYIDESISPFSGKYRLQYLNTDKSVEQNSLIQSYNLNPSNLSIKYFGNDKIVIVWNDNAFFESTIIVELESNSDTFVEIGRISLSEEQFTDFHISEKMFGKNRYRITAISEIDTSTTIYSPEFRLPIWEKYELDGNLIAYNYLIRYEDNIYGFTRDRGSDHYYSYKLNLIDLSVEKIQSSPSIEYTYGIDNLTILGNKFVSILPENNYAIYDPMIDNWEIYQEPLLDLRTESSIIKVDENRILISGGRRGLIDGELLKSALLYDISSNSWKEIADMNIPRYNYDSVRLNERLVLVGGSKTDFHDSIEIEVYNFDTNEWIRTVDPPINPFLMTVLENGNALILSENESVEFNPNKFSWENRVKFELNDNINKSLTYPNLVSLPGGNTILTGLIREAIYTSHEGIHSQIYLAKEGTWMRTGDLHFNTTFNSYLTIFNEEDLLLFNGYSEHIEVLKYANYR